MKTPAKDAKTADISLTEARNPVAGTFEFEGATYDVLKMTGEQYEAAALFEEKPVTAIFELAGQVCPSLPREILMKKLNRDDVAKITLMAGQGIAAVKALFPNAESPET